MNAGSQRLTPNPDLHELESFIPALAGDNPVTIEINVDVSHGFSLDVGVEGLCKRGADGQRSERNWKQFHHRMTLRLSVYRLAQGLRRRDRALSGARLGLDML